MPSAPRSILLPVLVILAAIATWSWTRGALNGLFVLHRGAPRLDPPLTGSAPARPLPALPAPDALPEMAGALLIPVAGVRAEQLHDTFNQSRADGARRHAAIDIAAPLGTPVLAAAAGKVERLFVSGPGGNTIYVRSPDRLLLFYYAHLDGYAPGLAEGRAVQPGDVIGRVGFSGNADPAQPHLHFAILRTTPQAAWYEPARPLNPFPLLRAARAAKP